jgi:transcriptional regulator with XRE-family HTH domain
VKPVPPGPVGAFAERLRLARRYRGLSREEVAKAMACSLATVRRAEAGDTLPQLPIARSYAAVCGVDPDEVETLWKRARRADRRRPGPAAPDPSAELRSVCDFAGLAALLVVVYEEAGAPSYRELERRAKPRARELAPLPRSTVGRVLAGAPLSERRLVAFLTACGVPEETFPLWLRARRRAHRSRTLARRRLSRVRAAEAAWSSRSRLEYERALDSLRPS